MSGLGDFPWFGSFVWGWYNTTSMVPEPGISGFEWLVLGVSGGWWFVVGGFGWVWVGLDFGFVVY